MDASIKITTTSIAEVTPMLLAEVFWSMSDIEQAEFFHQLADVVAEQSPCAYGMGEMQWCYMGHAVKERSQQAWEMFLAMSAFAYDYWPQKSANQ